jgi:hypothetical protein
MLRLWESVSAQSTHWLDRAVLDEELGGVEEIVRTYLDNIIAELPPSDQTLLAEFVHFTVTRTGTKIPSSAAGLADWAEIKGGKDDIERILTELSTGQNRIFRTVENIRDPDVRYYEVAHDALAPAILSWRERYQDRIKKFEFFRKWAWRVVPPVLVILAGLFYAPFQAYWSGSKFGVAEAVNANKVAEDTVELSARAQETSEKEFAEILQVLADLNTNSESKRLGALEKLQKLNSSSHISADTKAAVVIFAEKFLDAENVNQVRTIFSTSAEPVVRRVHIHIPGNELKPEAVETQKLLEKNSFVVPGIETVSRVFLNNTQVRYFREDDQDVAEGVRDLLLQNGIPDVRVQYFPKYENSPNARPNQVELWFANYAFPVEMTVDRTRDGVVSLKSTPNGAEAARVPGGSKVTRIRCERQLTQVDDRSGRWCEVKYRELSGWMFDGYLQAKD